MKESVICFKFLLIVLLSLLPTAKVKAAPSGEPLISLEVANASLQKLLPLLEEQAGVTFTYESSLLKNMPQINISFYRTPFSECMRKLCVLLSISYKQEGHFIILKRTNIHEVATNGLQFDSIQHLQEVVISATSLQKNLLLNPQMGQARFGYENIKSTPVLFGEADIIKIIQTQPGVSPGIAGFADMYVRGGNNDENLYLLEGNPLYQVNHAAGLFSGFNVEAIESTDFYKSAFPARYGGRLSSVVDIRTKDGNLREHHGNIMLGLTSGSFNLEGPLIKDKTSFNLNLRRTWFDILSAPALAIMNATKQDGADKTIARYAFTDLNLKLTHHFNSHSHAFAGIYFGRDYLKGGSKSTDENDKEEDISRLRWGNVMGFAGWSHSFNSRFYSNIDVAYTHYASKLQRNLKEQNDEKQTYYQTSSLNGIDDISLRTDFNYLPTTNQHIRFGSQYIYHRFRPEYSSVRSSSDATLNRDNRNQQLHAHELGIYAEDEWKLNNAIRLNTGLRFSLYKINNKTYTNLEPRISTAFHVAPQWSIKASYARMNQYVHQISESYINLPTDTWMPVNNKFKPLCSDQLSAGVYYTPNKNYAFSAEGYYKWLNHILDYKDGYNYLSSFAEWENKFTAGKGNTYGIELFARKETGKITGYIGYALSWNNRQFDEINHGKSFPAKFDNRHKLNIVANWQINKKVELNASWTYMTGNRVTVSFENQQILGQVQSPQTGNIYPGQPLLPHFHPDEGVGYYTTRNNFRLPAYHRLDLGINIYRSLKKGRTGIWNISIYNAYCYMAPVGIYKRFWTQNPMGSGYYPENKSDCYFETLRLIPIIPSVSYTYKF